MDIRAELTYTKKHQIGVGQGLNSEVFLSFDPQLGGEIAVKEIAKAGKVTTDYFREAQTMFAADHPNVVPISYACETPDKICLAMRYYRNGSLQDRIDKAPVSLKELIELGQGILNGLGCIHRLGFVHFDIKPSNIFFAENGNPMVADFGQSRMIGQGGFARTPGMYRHGIPPECYGGVGSFHSDIYQVGLTLYRAVNGSAWFECQKPSNADAELLTLQGDFPDRDRFLPHVSPALRKVICKAMEVDPVDRFRSCRELADALGKVDFGTNWSVSTEPSGKTTWVAKRNEQPDLIVELIPNGPKWDVEIHTSRRGTPRRKDLANWTQKSLTHKQALAHLRKIFRAQE